MRITREDTTPAHLASPFYNLSIVYADSYASQHNDVGNLTLHLKRHTCFISIQGQPLTRGGASGRVRMPGLPVSACACVDRTLQLFFISERSCFSQFRREGGWHHGGPGDIRFGHSWTFSCPCLEAFDMKGLCVVTVHIRTVCMDQSGPSATRVVHISLAALQFLSYLQLDIFLVFFFKDLSLIIKYKYIYI